MKQMSIILRYAAKRNTRKGSYTLEAALLLPLFIVGILTVGFTIRMISTAENITFAAVDEARLISATAYNIPMAPIFSGHLEQRILQENQFVTATDVSNFFYLYPSLDNDGLISFRIDAMLKTGLPLGMTNVFPVEQRFRCRGFIGRTAAGTPMSFDEMEKDKDGTIVWLFPTGGEKYHSKTCTFVSSYPMQMILNSELKKGYMPCPKCGSESAEDGMQVFCFRDYGESYHLQGCPLVDKYVISMEVNQAEARGYTPCLKCGGVE